MNEPVVIFDGECNLCCWSVQFIIQRDPAARVRFASAQSMVGTDLLSKHGYDVATLDGVVVIDQGKAFSHSDAALRIARYLSGWWSLLGVLRVIPRPVRDVVYGFIARNRYRWFGRRTACLVPTPDLRRRFID